MAASGNLRLYFIIISLLVAFYPFLISTEAAVCSSAEVIHHPLQSQPFNAVSDLNITLLHYMPEHKCICGTDFTTSSSFTAHKTRCNAVSKKRKRAHEDMKRRQELRLYKRPVLEDLGKDSLPSIRRRRRVIDNLTDNEESHAGPSSASHEREMQHDLPNHVSPYYIDTLK